MHGSTFNNSSGELSFTKENEVLDVLWPVADVMMSANEEVRGGKTGGDDFTGSLADVTDSGVFLQSAVSLLLLLLPHSKSQRPGIF